MRAMLAELAKERRTELRKLPMGYSAVRGSVCGGEKKSDDGLEILEQRSEPYSPSPVKSISRCKNLGWDPCDEGSYGG